MGDYDFWTHGTSVQVEYPKRLNYIRRAGWGTDIRQKHGTSNWFHLPIPTPTIINGSRPKYGKVWLRADTWKSTMAIDQEEAFIREIHVWDANTRIKVYNTTHNDMYNIPHGGSNCGTVNWEAPLPEGEPYMGLVICVRVLFEPPPNKEPANNLGEIRFISAGARFDL